MKRVLLFVVLAVVSSAVLAGGRHGHRHHHHHSRLSLGFHFGFPLGWYHPWHAPAYYYPATPVVVQPPAPPVYMERSDVVPEGPGTWYFCRESNTYYPYVKQCPGGWSRVPAQPSN